MTLSVADFANTSVFEWERRLRALHNETLLAMLFSVPRELYKIFRLARRTRRIHVLVRGRLPGIRRRKGDFEVYGAGHYFAITGNHVEGTPSEIEQRQEALNSFYREVFGNAS